MENTTILVILIIVIIFLYLNSKSNKVEQFASIEQCNRDNLSYRWGDMCKDKPAYMRRECPQFCGRVYWAFIDLLKKKIKEEKDILEKRQFLLDTGQDVTKVNLELKEIYDDINFRLYYDYQVVVFDNINFNPNTKEKLESAIQPMISRLEKIADPLKKVY